MKTLSEYGLFGFAIIVLIKVLRVSIGAHSSIDKCSESPVSKRHRAILPIG